VAGGGSGEVLWLGGYTSVRPEPKAEEKRGCGAHRGGKWWRRFGANLARAAALRRSRPLHGPCREGEKGAGEPRCRAWPQNERERASTAFDREKKGKGEGSGVGGATQRKEEGRAVTPRRGGRRGRGGTWQPMVCGTVAPAASRQRRVWVGVVARGSRGTGRRVWAVHEHVGRPGEGKSRGTWI
jgi:hypothetical protein